MSAKPAGASRPRFGRGWRVPVCVLLVDANILTAATCDHGVRCASASSAPHAKWPWWPSTDCGRARSGAMRALRRCVCTRVVGSMACVSQCVECSVFERGTPSLTDFHNMPTFSVGLYACDACHAQALILKRTRHRPAPTKSDSSSATRPIFLLRSPSQRSATGSDQCVHAQELLYYGQLFWRARLWRSPA